MMYPEAYLNLNGNKKLEVLDKIDSALKQLSSTTFPYITKFISNADDKKKVVHRIIYYMHEPNNPKTLADAITKVELELS